MDYYSVTIKNIFESILMRQMNLELIVENEFSQKTEDKYCILTHIYGILKDGTEEFVCKASNEKQTKITGKTGMGKGKERVR